MTRRLLCALLLVSACGCREVDDRLVWSPDGTQAVLRADTDLYIVGSDGTLSGTIASGVTGAAWLPDSRGLALTTTRNLTKWADAERLLPEVDLAAARELADLYLLMIPHDQRQLDDLIQLKRLDIAMLAMVYLSDQKHDALQAAIRKSKDAEKLEADLKDTPEASLAELSVLMLPSRELRVIHRGIGRFSQPAPSPAGGVIAFRHDEQLLVASTDGATKPTSMTDRIVGPFGWTPNGKSVVYPSRLSDKDSDLVVLASLEQHVVVDDSGKIVDGQSRSMALNLSSFAPRLVCLRDGRMIFSGVAVPLPAPSESFASTQFFMFDPAARAGAAPAPIRVDGALSDDLSAFVPSPDGRRIAVVDDDSDAVIVIDVTTGRQEVVSPKRTGQTRMLPAWRGSNELYFVALPSESAARPDLYRWQPGSAPQVVSATWPDAVLKTLLQKPGK